ncbi:hypothetical protein D9M73_76600 [compost metagenome]
MKSALLMLSVEATRPPTLTCEPAPNSTPLGFRIKTWPLAVRLPSSSLGLLPVMRLRAIAEALGWLKTSASFVRVDKLVQSIATRWLPWLIVVVLPTVARLAVPMDTLAFAASAACACCVATRAKDAVKPNAARHRA